MDAGTQQALNKHWLLFVSSVLGIWWDLIVATPPLEKLLCVPSLLKICRLIDFEVGERSRWGGRGDSPADSLRNMEPNARLDPTTLRS